MRKIFLYPVLIIFLIFVTLNWHCLKSKRPGIPVDVRQTFSLSGINKQQLILSLEPYFDNDDSIKLKAMYWLLANMKSNYTVHYHVQDTMGDLYVFNPELFPDYIHLKHHWDSLEQKVGNLIYKPDTFLLDCQSLSAKYLQNNMELSYKSWKSFLWSKNYSFDFFKKWILPYRCANEQVEPFRKHFLKKFGNAIDTLTNTNPFIVAKKLNELINKEIDYKDTYNRELNIQAIDSLEHKHYGNFFDIAAYKVKALRSFGIAAALDYSPFLADTNYGCAWATAFDTKGGEYYLFPKTTVHHLFKKGRMAKTYRMTFTTLKNSLYAIKKTSTTTPPFLGHWNYIDVTNSLQSANVNINIKNKKTKYSYLSVFNDGEWHPIDWALQDSNGIARFSKMGTGIIYLPLRMKKDKEFRLGYPFLLEEDRVKHYLIPDFHHTISVTITKVAPFVAIVPNKKYTLYIWNGNWQNISEFYGSSSPLTFSLPRNSLYLISDNNIDFIERIFIVGALGYQVFK